MEGNEHLTWKRSTRSGDNGGNCVEIATDGSSAYVRDSKLVQADGTYQGPVLAVTANDLRSLIRLAAR